MSQPTFVTLEDSRHLDIPNRVSTDDPGAVQATWPTDFYFGEPYVLAPNPQAFRVSYEPHNESRAHFHHVDQFQVFFGGSDTVFQRHPAGFLLVHYADADTLYGPFSSGDQPFSFLTLRPRATAFKGFLPENKADMAHDRAKRHSHEELTNWLESSPASGSDADISTIIEPGEDHLAAYKIAAPAGSKVTGPSPASSGGQYYVVVQGEFAYEGKTLSKFTVGWVGCDDDAPVLVAGENGGHAVVLQFGTQDPAAVS